ncbi:DMT family transporter [Massilia sp. W12]|uniref:DMT family transporter n=1 Tax=Massilia sp. W12 TaxID=3126507 RepID=UPI0030D1CDCA
MSSTRQHRQAILLMIIAPAMWSIAGVFTRHLEAARSFEVTFWRSLFAALFILVWLGAQGRFTATLRAAGRWGVVSGFMWCLMFSCFMLAMTLTTVANTLVVMSIAPLLTALLAFFILGQKIAMRTWGAILLALLGVVWMCVGGMREADAAGGNAALGMLVAFAVPLASSINLITLKKAGAAVDLIPAIFIGGVLSCLFTLPFAWPLQASLHDVLILAILGVFQLGVPCMLMLRAAPHLSAPELSLLSLLEVLLGPLWAWLWANETPGAATLYGGALVLLALIVNEALGWRAQTRNAADAGNPKQVENTGAVDGGRA